MSQEVKFDPETGEISRNIKIVIRCGGCQAANKDVKLPNGSHSGNGTCPRCGGSGLTNFGKNTCNRCSGKGICVGCGGKGFIIA